MFHFELQIPTGLDKTSEINLYEGADSDRMKLDGILKKVEYGYLRGRLDQPLFYPYKIYHLH